MATKRKYFALVNVLTGEIKCDVMGEGFFDDYKTPAEAWEAVTALRPAGGDKLTGPNSKKEAYRKGWRVWPVAVALKNGGPKPTPGPWGVGVCPECSRFKGDDVTVCHVFHDWRGKSKYVWPVIGLDACVHFKEKK